MELDPITKYILEGINYRRPCAKKPTETTKCFKEYIKAQGWRMNITPRSRFLEDLHLDKLQVVEMFIYMMECLDIDIPDTDADEKVKTVGDLVKFLSDKKNVRCR
jgi:acyl carrier protein